MATTKVREDRFAPLAVGLVLAAFVVGLVFAASEPGERVQPYVPAVLVAANGLLAMVRPAAYLVLDVPRWYVKDGARGEPSTTWLWSARVVGLLLVAAAVLTVVLSLLPEADDTCWEQWADVPGSRCLEGPPPAS